MERLLANFLVILAVEPSKLWLQAERLFAVHYLTTQNQHQLLLLAASKAVYGAAGEHGLHVKERVINADNQQEREHVHLAPIALVLEIQLKLKNVK